MTVTSPLWMRVTWLGLLLAAFYLPLYFLGIELKNSESCAPDIPWSDYEAVRKLAKWTWAGSLLSVGALLAAATRIAPSHLGAKPIWAGFVIWKSLTLALAFVASPACFESYGGENVYTHPLEDAFAMGSIFAWVVLLVLIFVGLVVGPKGRSD